MTMSLALEQSRWRRCERTPRPSCQLLIGRMGEAHFGEIS